MNSAEQVKDLGKIECRDSVVVLRILEEGGQWVIAPFWRLFFNHATRFGIRL